MTTKLILEIGCNHNGNIEIAIEMIDDAAKLNVWGVKFQKRDIASMPEHLRKSKRGGPNDFGKTYEEHRRHLEFNSWEIQELKTYAEKKQLNFVVSVFDPVSFLNMKEIGIRNIKLPSQLLSNYEMNELFKFHKSIHTYHNQFCSTGMHTVNEVIENPWINNYECVFYCRSIYPCNLNQINFIDMRIIRDEIKPTIGYSSHDKNGEAIKYAVLLGAEYIERHYTLDKKMKGSDHKTVSSEFEEIKRIQSEIEEMENILGKVYHDLCDEEKKVKLVYRNTY